MYCLKVKKEYRLSGNP